MGLSAVDKETRTELASDRESKSKIGAAWQSPYKKGNTQASNLASSAGRLRRD